MSIQLSIYDKISSIFTKGENEGILFKTVSRDSNSKVIENNSNTVMHDYGTCAYLGIDTDPSILSEVTTRLQNYGTRFSSSQVYARSCLYDEAEAALKNIFDSNILLSTTTTLGHQIAIPVLIYSDSIVCYDEFVHNSIKQALKLRYNIPQKKLSYVLYKFIKNLFRSKVNFNFHTDVKLPHNSLQKLERILTKYPSKKVWYLCDGIYSMYGDTAPFDEIDKLLKKYNNLNIYIDDAHGFGISGKNGCGSAFDVIGNHPRVVYTYSLAKAVSATGGFIVCQNENWHKLMRYFGENFTFGCSISNSGLLEIKASIMLLCSEKGNLVRRHLIENISKIRKVLTNKKIMMYVDNQKYPSPIIHIPIGDIEKTANLVIFLRKKGYYVIPTSYPAVRVKDTGLRLTVTSNQNEQEYVQLADYIHSFLAEN